MSTPSLYPLPGPPAGPVNNDFLAPPEILGQSASITRLRTYLSRLGPHFRTALIRGEPGTGKELAARTLHARSSHATGPFIIFRATHERESIRQLIQRAHRGTIYVDHVEKITSEAQAELLEFLKSRERQKQTRLVVHGLEARVIASTTEDLRILTAAGRFRQELYARFSAVEVELPPLRERQEDIPLLAEHFLKQHTHLRVLARETLERMQEYRWPGNLTELKQRIHSATLVCKGGLIEAEDLALTETTPVLAPAPEFPASTRLQEVVEQHVFRVLKVCAGNKVKAAELLGISRSTLYRMLDAGLQADKMVDLR